MAGFLGPASAAPISADSPFIVTISFKQKLTDSYIAEFATYEIIKHRPFNEHLTEVTFTYDSRDADAASRQGNRISLEWRHFPYFTYDFDTQRGELNFADGVNLVDRDSFRNGSGSYWYETDTDPTYEAIRGKLRRVSVVLSAPGEPVVIPPVPLPASLPMLALGMVGLSALRRRS